MRETPDSLPYGKYLPDVYRFAFLMTGHAGIAADVLRHTVGRATRGGLNDIRNPLHAKRWLFAEARTLCAHPPPPATARGDVPAMPVPSGTDAATPGEPVPNAPVPSHTLSNVDVPAVAVGDPPRQLAILFADLPEIERSALILFYLFLFDPGELSELLEIAPAELGPLLLRGRTLLQRHGDLCENLFAAATAASDPAAETFADPAGAHPPDVPAPTGTGALSDAA